VAVLPKEFNKDNAEKTSYWNTDLEVKVGDIVISCFLNSLNAKVLITDDGSEYRLISYFALIVALRKEKVICLNGYFLFTRMLEEIKTTLWVPNQKKRNYDTRLGLVEYVGNPVHYYHRDGGGDFDKGINIQRGDKVLFLTSYSLFAPPLENEKFRIMDKDYYYAQRYRLAGKVE